MADKPFCVWLEEKAPHSSLCIDIYEVGVVGMVVGMDEERGISMVMVMEIEHGVHVDVDNGVTIKHEKIVLEQVF